MDEPVTQLDERFSDPGGPPTTWAAAREVLEAAQLSWIIDRACRRAPACHAAGRGVARRSAPLPTGPTEQKAVNLTTNPNVVLTTGCNTWDQGLDVMVEGEAPKVLAFGRRAGPGSIATRTVFTHTHHLPTGR